MRRVLWVVGFVVGFGLGSPTFAQDEPDSLELEGELDADAALGEAPELVAEDGADQPAAPAAAGGRPNFWVGPFVDAVIVPSFLLNIFLAESPTVANPAFGATIAHRDESGFSWILGLGYTGYGFDGPFRAKSDPELDTEYLESDLGLLHARGQLMWSVELSDMFAFEYGVGIELGVVLGELVRSEAYRDASGEFRPCRAPLTPDLVFCEVTTDGSPSNAYDEEGAHYNVSEERVPPVAVGLMLPALALRFMPADNVQIKLETSFGLMRFTVGLSAAYGFGA